MTGPNHVLVTGATSAIGSALALSYARKGTTLNLQGRNAERLEKVAAACEAQGAQVGKTVLDLRDFAALRSWLEKLGPVDLLIINAGVNTHVGPSGELEPWSEVEALLDVNLKAAMMIVQAVLPALRAQNSGQIALISSLAGYFGLPVTPTYSASKAALKAYGEALRGWLGPEGVRVNVVMPGFVKSPMCDDMPGPKPLLWSPERAAKAIQRGLERDKARISFPFPLNCGTWLLSVLPAGLSIQLLRLVGFSHDHR